MRRRRDALALTHGQARRLREAYDVITEHQGPAAGGLAERATTLMEAYAKALAEEARRARVLLMCGETVH